MQPRCAFLAAWLFAVTAAWGALADEASFDESLAAKIDAHAKPYLDSEYIGGMTIGVVHHGAMRIVGYGDSGAGVPTADTIYEIGSISKVFTSLLLADAVVRGAVKLDQSASELLPAGVTMPSREGESITLQHLATHVSGLPPLPSNMPLGDLDNPYADYTEALLYKFLSAHTLRRLPGKRSEYSNLAVGLLGNLLARQAQVSYDELLANRIAKPLAMTETTIDLSDAQRDRLAFPHTVDGSESTNWDIGALAGAGAIRSTTRDMVTFARAILDPPESDLGTAIELTWREHQPAIDKTDFAMGLGWHIARDGNTRWHNGETGGYHSMLMVNRDAQSAVVILSNTATNKVDTLAEAIMRTLAGVDEPVAKFEPLAKVEAATMQKLVGDYSLWPFGTIKIREQDGKLLAQLTGQQQFRLFPASETKWSYRVVEAEITFALDDAGKCIALELFQNGIRRTAKRVADE